MDEYWPRSAAPPTPGAWRESVAGFHRDLQGLRDLAEDASVNLFDRIPHGSGQSYLRELLLVADHNAYHVGQMILVRRALGNWSR